jgi:hypothetical protein
MVAGLGWDFGHLTAFLSDIVYLRLNGAVIMKYKECGRTDWQFRTSFGTTDPQSNAWAVCLVPAGTDGGQGTRYQKWPSYLSTGHFWSLPVAIPHSPLFGHLVEKFSLSIKFRD